MPEAPKKKSVNQHSKGESQCRKLGISLNRSRVSTNQVTKYMCMPLITRIVVHDTIFQHPHFITITNSSWLCQETSSFNVGGALWQCLKVIGFLQFSNYISVQFRTVSLCWLIRFFYLLDLTQQSVIYLQPTGLNHITLSNSLTTDSLTGTPLPASFSSTIPLILSPTSYSNSKIRL